MQYGISLPNFNAFGDPHMIVRLARLAEEASWDAFFLWDHILFDDLSRPLVDPWLSLAAAAVNTRRLRLGTMLTPLPRRRPWQLARQVLTLDHLSGGRVILCVGLGDPARWEYGFFHEETDPRIRAEKLDESLAILNGLWSGKPFSFHGKHYQLEEMTFLPTPLQEHIPIWVGGYWPNKAPFRRAARFDGVCPGGRDGPLSPDDWRSLLAYINSHRDQPYQSDDEPFAAAASGVTPGDDPQKAAGIIAPFAAAGANWWIEDISPYGYGLDWDKPWPEAMVTYLENRVRQGPPRVE